LQVRIVQDEYYSTGYGHDYEYIGPRSATAEGNGPEDSPCDPGVKERNLGIHRYAAIQC